MSNETSNSLKLPEFQGHTYEIFGDVVAIIDGKVGMSVTNSIDYWIKVICQSNGFSSKDKKWIYRDSLDVWDGYNPQTHEFISLNTKNFNEALWRIRKSGNGLLSQ